MADDESISLSSGDTPDEGQGAGGETEPSFAPDHDSDVQQPKPGSQDRVISHDEIMRQHEAVNNALKGVLEQQRTNASQDAELERELRAIKEEASKGPPQEQPPMALPAPPGQEDKNNIAVLATNILKWGALIGLAYGTTRRSPMRGSLFKLGLASALEAHYAGRTADRNQALALWEKNRQYIMDQNRLQHQQYMDTFNNRKLTLQQKIDVFREQSTMWGNKRGQQAAERQSLVDIQKNLNDEIHMEREYENQMRQDRKEWYKLLHLDSREGAEYRDWVIRVKGGPDVAKIDVHDADAWHKVETKYTRHEFLEQKHKEDQEREVETAKKKAAATARGKFEEKQREKLEEERSSDNPLGLNLK